jgi:hypothetical protein
MSETNSDWKSISPDIEEEFSLKDDISIDKYNLEDEWKRQPYVIYRWAALLAEAEKQVEVIKNRLELERSNLDAKVRTNPSEYGFKDSKVTETAIARALSSNEGLMKTQNELIEARRRYGVINAAYQAINHKRPALENLVKLFLNNYYSEPYVPKEAKDISQDQTKAEVTKQLEGYKRRRFGTE